MGDIDFQNKYWRISEIESKNKDVNMVVLCEPALDILERRFKENNLRPLPSAFVFPGTGKNGYIDDPKKAFRRIRMRMGVYNFRIHDLRRTLGSYMAITGASLPIIGNALNHKSHVSTEIYARLSQKPVLEAVNKAVKMIRGKSTLELFKQNDDLLVITAIKTSLSFSELV